ncbi:MAG: hypothetical protein AAGF12_00840 [Myxococcota bacterium]
MHHFSCAGFAVVLMVGCGSEDQSAPAPPPVTAPEPTPEVVEETTPSAPSGEASRSFPASTTEPLPMAVGQWSKHRFITADGNEDGELSYKIVGEQDGAHWIEIEMTGPATIGFRLLLAFEDRSRADSAEVREVIVRMPNGQLQRFGGAMLTTMRGQYREWTRGLRMNWEDDAPRETVEVPAGRFEGCFKRESDGEFGPLDRGGTTWSHTAVPLTGLIKMEATDGARIELVEFGLEGAESTFDGPVQDLNIAVPGALLERLMQGAGMQ